ncbi:aminoglycoside 6-adenylyltransferase [Enterococcus sp. BWR-S5]|uniref:aminoglycoside 6-adenylyltransferase n=1 Tax=Enterococcus sp. BWR-S5 TaxID=2787714 RepID=UPI001920CA8C|nr:aminoglycoside 6-adenylyltransferase [Enterococcus sp. BWR-S5]MBL1224541.1 aminoglycoside 6-adenylyltransferase [Enterococcus sp. BWR-S5]
MGKQDFYTEFVEQFAVVGQKRKDIKAAYIIGSRARKKHPADEWSDLDILMYSDTPDYYLKSNEYLTQFGEIWSSFTTKTLGGDSERLTLFAGGYQVDLVVKDSKEYEGYIASGEIPWLFKRGAKLILAHDKRAEQLLPTQEVLPEKLPLNEATLNEVNQMFWFMTMYISKQLLREENWSAKARDMDYKNILLQLIEWYEQCLHGADYDTWHGGRFLKKWAEPDIYAELFDVFGHFELADSWKALEHSIKLFVQLINSVQTIANIDVENGLQENVIHWIKSKNNHFLAE